MKETIENLQILIKTHIQEDEQHYSQLKDIRDDIRAIKENHLHHIERDLNIMRNDMAWVKRFFWVVATTTITAVILPRLLTII